VNHQVQSQGQRVGVAARRQLAAAHVEAIVAAAVQS